MATYLELRDLIDGSDLLKRAAVAVVVAAEADDNTIDYPALEEVPLWPA